MIVNLTTEQIADALIKYACFNMVEDDWKTIIGKSMFIEFMVQSKDGTEALRIINNLTAEISFK